MIKIQPTPNYISNHKQTPAFGSVKLCQGAVMKQLADGTKKSVPVEVRVLGAEDYDYIRAITNRWTSETDFGRIITKTFLDVAEKPFTYSKNMRGRTFFMLKPVNREDFGSDKPLCLAMLTRCRSEMDPRDTATLVYLQTAAQAIKSNAQRVISGAGEMLMYGISKFLNSTNCNKLRFIPASSSLNFYEKILKLQPEAYPRTSIFLDKAGRSNFLARTEEKYGLQNGTEITEETLKAIDERTY